MYSVLRTFVIMKENLYDITAVIARRFFLTITISVEFCPTHIMIADYFTKPLQGKAFQIFSDLIMGFFHIDTLVTAFLPINDHFEKGSRIKIIEKLTVLC